MNPEENYMIRPIHYLGSKLRMLETVKEAVDMVDFSNGCVCDLFSGSGTVSKYLSSYRDVISADIQRYSGVLCEATMSFCHDAPRPEDILTEIMNSDVRFKLGNLYGNLLGYENESMERAREGDIDQLYEIIEKGSIYIYLKGGKKGETGELYRKLEELSDRLVKADETISLDSMITRYYGGLYFSYKQSLQMDCIEQFVFGKEGLLKTKLLAALLSTASEIVNTVGKQFAQPLKVRDGEGRYKRSLLKKILDDRSMDVYAIYERWLGYYLSEGESQHAHRVICADYVDVLENLKGSTVSVVYADPPYTRYHYSRYYHVLETICLRDNPNVTTTFANGNGGISRAVYREGRHQSPFCIKSQAENAFDRMFAKVRELKVPLVLSYSPFDATQAVTPRLQTVDQLMDKAKQYFSYVLSISPGEFTHSKLNSSVKNFEANHEAEILILCRS